MFEPIFNNIQKRIAERLACANSRVYVAVAWFTNEILFKEILRCCKSGLDVNVIIMDDYINRNEYGLDFSEMIKSGGNLFFATDKKMHNKFCIIDDTIITGSYNWTYYAEKLNYENIILTDDFPLVSAYVEEYRKILSSSIMVNDYIPLKLSGMTADNLISDYSYLCNDLVLKRPELLNEIETFNNKRNIKLRIERNQEIEFDFRRIPLLNKEFNPSHLDYRLNYFSIGVVPYDRPNAGKKYVHAKLCSNDIYIEDTWVDIFDEEYVNDLLNYFHKNEGGLIDNEIVLPSIPEFIYNPRKKYLFGLVCYHFYKFGQYGNERHKIGVDGKIILDKDGNPCKYSKFYTMVRYNSEIQERLNSCFLLVKSLFIPNGIDENEKVINSKIEFLA